jgi:hypothetical protein
MFELAWRGGATEARLHARRPGADALPWGTIDRSAPGIDDARQIWTNGVFTEYASAAAFSELTTAMLQCGAPIDLIATCADIAVDELFHVELAGRLVMDLGGAVPLEFDLANIAPRTTPGVRPLMRAAEIAITTACVSEALSLPAIVYSCAHATEPLVRAVIERLLADEGPHSRLGYWFLEWAELTDDERARLARIAVETIAVYQPVIDACPEMRDTVTRSIVTPLARYGIRLL